jgi:TRAP-type transport system small permease protein
LGQVITKGNGFARTIEIMQSFSLKFNAWIAIIFSVWMFLTIFQIVIDVAGRYLFSAPLKATYSISEVMIVFFVYMGLTYTETKGGNIRIDFLINRFPRKLQDSLEILFLIGGLVIIALIIWQTFLTASQALQYRQTALDYPIPLYPGKFAISAGFFLLFIQFLLNLFTKISTLSTGKEHK